MSLPVYTPIPYLSYSTFKLARECLYSVYLQKCCNISRLKDIETEQMAMGTAFDAFIKYYLSLKLGKSRETKNKLANLLANIDKSNQHVIKEAHEICQYYISQGRMTRLLDNGLEDIEVNIQENIPGLQGTILAGIPIFGKLDAKLKRNIPLDWKVTGYKASRTISPKKGYINRIDCGISQPPHIEAGIALNNIDPDWAEQLTFYNWVLQNDITEPFHGAIEQIIINKNNLSFCSYMGFIEQEFINNLLDQVVDIWTKLTSGDIEIPVISKQRCEPYGRPRICTMICPEYNKQGDILDKLI